MLAFGMEKVFTHWLKRQLQQLGAEADLNQLTSLVENKDKLVFRMAKSWVLLKARSSEVRKQFVLCLSWGA